MKKIILLILLFFSFGLSNTLLSQCNVGDAEFPITDSEQYYLYYLTYTNHIDTAFVTCKSGKFKIMKNNSRDNIIIIRDLDKDNLYDAI